MELVYIIRKKLSIPITIQIQHKWDNSTHPTQIGGLIIQIQHEWVVMVIRGTMCVGFINPGFLVDRLPRKGSAQADSAQLMGW